jgi:hypothetical protein
MHAVRARWKAQVPVMVQREEVAHVMAVMAGITLLVAPRRYGIGQHIMQALWLQLQCGMKAVALPMHPPQTASGLVQ